MSSSICSGRLRAALQAPAQNDFDGMLGCKETRVALVSKQKGKTSGEPDDSKATWQAQTKRPAGPDPNEHLRCKQIPQLRMHRSSHLIGIRVCVGIAAARYTSVCLCAAAAAAAHPSLLSMASLEKAAACSPICDM